MDVKKEEDSKYMGTDDAIEILTTTTIHITTSGIHKLV